MKPYNYSNDNKIKKLYLEEKKTLNDIAQILGLSASTICRHLKHMDIERRSCGSRKKGHKHSEETKRKLSLARMGSKNPMWKGNKASKRAGRSRIRRKLNCPEGKEIHHIDGNPLNNKPENLLIVTRKEHMNLDGRTAQLKKRLTSSEFQETKRKHLRPPNVICNHCGKAFRTKPSRLKITKFCSNECFRAGMVFSRNANGTFRKHT